MSNEERDSWLKAIKKQLDSDQRLDLSQIKRYEELIAEIEDRLRQRGLLIIEINKIPVRD